MIRIARFSFYTLSLLLLALSLYVHSRPIAVGDKLWQLQYAHMWLGGKQLYTDLVAVNPPLIYWLYALPAAFSQTGWLTDLQGLFLLGLCLLSASLYLSMRLIALHPAFSAAHHRRYEFALLFCFLFIFRTNVHYFADREHLFLLLIFPYLLRFMPALARLILPIGLSMAIGIMAAIGFCMKPHCLIVFIGVQLFVMLREKKTRIIVSPENLLIYTIGACYLFVSWYLYLDFFRIVIPMALATYSATRDPTPIWFYLGNSVYTLLAGFFMFRPRYDSPYRRDIYYFLFLCPFFYLYALANNNWAYAYYPLGTITLFLTGLLLWEFTFLRKEYTSLHKRSWVFSLGILGCVCTFIFRIAISLLTFQAVIFYGCFDSLRCAGDEPFAAEVKNQNGPPLSFGTISIDYTRWSELSRYTGAHWETRFPQLWMLPKLLIEDDAFVHAHQWIIEYIGDAYADDLERNKPEVMFVDDTNLFYTAHKHVDLVDYFRVVPSFREAWKHYELLHKIDMCRHDDPVRIRCAYDVYRRK